MRKHFYIFLIFFFCKISLQDDCDTVCDDQCAGLNEVQTASGQCVCRNSYARDVATGRCMCPINQVEVLVNCTSCSVFYGTACVCPRTQLKCECPSTFNYNLESKICCPPREVFVKGCGCVCQKPFIRNPVTKTCDCPLNEVLVNGRCECVKPLVRDQNGVCCGKYETFSTLCNACVCKKGFVYFPSTKTCVCPLNEVLSNGICVCRSGTFRDLITGMCCPINEVYSNGKCVCKPGYYRPATSKSCILGTCPSRDLVCE